MYKPSDANTIPPSHFEHPSSNNTFKIMLDSEILFQLSMHDIKFHVCTRCERDIM